MVKFISTSSTSWNHAEKLLEKCNNVKKVNMAKFKVRFSLCPLIDQRSLLGVTADSSTECVIVTLGKNMIVRFKVSMFLYIFENISLSILDYTETFPVLRRS